MNQFNMTPHEYRQKQYMRFREYEAQQRRRLPSETTAKVQGGASFAARWGAAIAALVVCFFAFNMVIQLVIMPRLDPAGNMGGVLTIFLGIIAPIFIMFAVKNSVKKRLAASTKMLHQQVEEAIAVRKHETEQDIQDYCTKYDAWQARLRAQEEARQAQLRAEEEARQAREAAAATQRSAMEMANNENLDMLAGQLCLQFKQRIDSADRNQFLRQIMMTLSMEFDVMNLAYRFWQTGSVAAGTGSEQNAVKVPYYQISAPENMGDPIVRNSFAQALASKIQFKMMELYAGAASPALVEVHLSRGSGNAIGYKIVFRMDNPQYTGSV